MTEPKLEDFYDSSDPRGPSSSEFEDYLRALNLYHESKNTPIEPVSTHRVYRDN